MITFAVIGHNEASTLANAIAQATEAAGPEDRVWFVDSASTDDSAAIAASCGAEVIGAPLGKGRAMSQAIELCEAGHVCFLDADIESSTLNIPLALRASLAAGGADMVVGEFVEPAKRIRNTSTAIYRPLVESLFPEALDRCGATPISGFRIVSVQEPLGQLPPGFGVEAHLNVLFAVKGRKIAVADVGIYRGPVRPRPELAWETARAIIDLAEKYGRLGRDGRAEWDAWAEKVVSVIRTQPEAGCLDDYRERLAAAARHRPNRG